VHLSNDVVRYGEYADAMSSPSATAFRPSADTPLARFIVGMPGPPPSLDDLRGATLSGAMLARLSGHPEHLALRADARRTAVRHLAVKTALRDLLEAWNEVDLVPLVVKGFYMAEFVYPSAAQRVYADVDLFVDQERVAGACEAAARLGWEIVWRDGEPDSLWSARRSGYRGHEAAKIHHPGIDVSLDIHRRLVHNSQNGIAHFPLQSRLTQAAVSSAIEVPWEGVRLRLPQPVDAAVFGMALNRCWGSDGWRIKPRDYCDLEALRAQHGLQRSEIMARARELGVERTVAIYLSRCDPYRQRLMLAAPRLRARWWNLRVLFERGPHDAIRDAMALVESLEAGLMLGRAWPAARRATRFVRRRGPLEAWADRNAAAEVRARPMSSRDWSNLRRAIHRHHRLGRIADHEGPTVAALVAFAWLRRRGYPVELRTEGDDARSAAVFLDGKPLRPHGALTLDDGG
jgi:hypothetical protein